MRATIIILLFCVCCTIEAKNQTYELQFKPFGEVIYYCGIQTENMNGYVLSPLIFRVDSVFKNDKFTYLPYSVANGIFPGGMSTSRGSILHMVNGAPFWNAVGFKLGAHLPFDIEGFRDLYDFILFPYFSKKNYSIGDTWQKNLPAPITFTTNLDITVPEKAMAYFKEKSTVRFHFNNVTQMLGYTCAEIPYEINDSLINKKGDTLRFVCRGKTYFAIKEGFIVSDIQTVSHDRENSEGNYLKQSFTRKLRMVAYTPYNETTGRNGE